MGHIRFRRSIKVAPGIKVNFNKKSVSTTVGGKGIHYTVSSSGKRTTSAGVPGSGLYYTNTTGGGKRHSKSNKNKNRARVSKSSTVNESEKQPRYGNSSVEKKGESEDAVGRENGGVKKTKYQKASEFGKKAVTSFEEVKTTEAYQNTFHGSIPLYKQTWFAVLMLFVFFPVGLYLLWKYADCGRRVKAVITGIIAVLLAVGIVFANHDSSSVGTRVVEETTATPSIETTTSALKYTESDITLQQVGDELVAMAFGQQVPYSGILPMTDGTYVLANGKVLQNYSGIYDADGNAWLVDAGKVVAVSGVVKASDGMWVYAKDGIIQKGYSGIQKNNVGKWYINDGVVDFSFSGIATSDGATYIVKDGKVDTTQEGVMKVGNTWAYVADGMVAQNFTGVKSNAYGTWYVKNGIVQLDYDGDITGNDGKKYSVTKGKATPITTTTAAPQTTANNSSSGAGGAGNNFTTYDEQDDQSTQYVGNSGTMKFHYSSCSDVNKMNPANKVKGDSREWFIENDYKPCGHCRP